MKVVLLGRKGRSLRYPLGKRVVLSLFSKYVYCSCSFCIELAQPGLKGGDQFVVWREPVGILALVLAGFAYPSSCLSGVASWVEMKSWFLRWSWELTLRSPCGIRILERWMFRKTVDSRSLSASFIRFFEHLALWGVISLSHTPMDCFSS